jgi:acyl carrier protein
VKTAEFCAKLEDILEMPNGSIEALDRLENLKAWDSMAIMLFIAMADEQFHLSLDVSKIQACKTVQDLAGLLGQNVTM